MKEKIGMGKSTHKWGRAKERRSKRDLRNNLRKDRDKEERKGCGRRMRI